MSSKRKHLTLQEKFVAIGEADANPHESKVAIAKRLDINYSSFLSILKQKNEIIKTCQEAGSNGLKRRRMQNGRFADLEKILVKWFDRAQTQGLPVSGEMLKNKALEIAEKMNVTSEFKASTGWLIGFKERHGLSGRKTLESASTCIDNVEDWANVHLPNIIKDYELRDIYNCDETGLFYNILPDKTLDRLGETCHDGKWSEERLTVLFTVNADGSDKLRPLVIGKYENPRCFNGVKSFTTDYDFNTRSWMTRDIFQKYLQKLDQRMGEENRKILLFLDYCAAHVLEVELSNIRLEFFPVNYAIKMQPLDLGIIDNLKVEYRKLLLMHAVARLDAGHGKPKIHVLKAMNFISAAWNAIPQTTIVRCFRNAGIPTLVFDDADDGFISSEGTQEAVIQAASQANLFNGISFEDYVVVDSNLEVCGGLYEEESITDTPDSVQSYECKVEESDSVGPIPNLRETLQAFQTVSRFLSAQEAADEEVSSLCDLERMLYTRVVCSKHIEIKIEPCFETV